MQLLNDILYLIQNYSSLLFEGMRNTLLISIFGTIVGIILGLLLAVMRNQEIHYKDNTLTRVWKKGLRFIAIVYVDIVRGTPMMVQAAVFFYGLAYMQINLNPLVAGFVVVSFNTAAYISEIIRSGINGINEGQVEAARSLGLSHFEAMRHIVLPQALKNTVPALMNELIVNVKDTSVLSIIGVTELFYMTKAAASETYMTFPAYILTAIIYLFLTKTLTIIFAYILRKMESKEASMPQSQTVPEVI
ncbi:amino acid ABC transporter permease [Mollicutes bacterium LVI A0078]|nr:amino acid ABC transporter permease [Mollicutes bacterium LVI A0075]WOO91672.1 amino acid ABC transporter permease [Mollicutes bacterium LVI A0078]